MDSKLERPSQRHKYTIIIPAAGMGKRMKVYGPKSLVKVDNKDTILSRQLRQIQECFRRYQVIIVSGFQNERLYSLPFPFSLDRNIRVVTNEEYENTNVLHSINVGLKYTKTERVLIVYGDLVFNQECLNLPFGEKSAVVLSESMKSEEVGCISNNGYLENIFYKLPNKWAQIAYFTGKELEALKKLASKSSCKMWFGFEAINEIINDGGQFVVYKPINGKAVDIDSSYDLKLVEQI